MQVRQDTVWRRRMQRSPQRHFHNHFPLQQGIWSHQRADALIPLY
jgi:hypothetical protein